VALFSNPINTKKKKKKEKPLPPITLYPKLQGKIFYFFALLKIKYCWMPVTPVILATCGDEIRRIMVRGQPRQIVCKTPPPPCSGPCPK
jgi:hypothetical protein